MHIHPAITVPSHVTVERGMVYWTAIIVILALGAMSQLMRSNRDATIAG